MRRPNQAPERLGSSAHYKRWKATRSAFLQANLWCKFCESFGVSKRATEVDHIISRALRPDLTFTWSNLQGLCAPCHNSHKQREENQGFSDATASDGWPSDPRHPANRR